MGAVVGATEPEHIARLRELMPRSIFLIPGVGAQGGRPELLGAAFAAGPGCGARRRLARHRRRSRSRRRGGAVAGHRLGDIDRLTRRSSLYDQRRRSDSPAPMKKRSSAVARILAASPWWRRSSWSWSRSPRPQGDSESPKGHRARRRRRPQKHSTERRAKTYVVQTGDTLTAIAHRTGRARLRNPRAQSGSRPPDPDRRRNAETAMRGGAGAPRLLRFWCRCCRSPARRRQGAGREPAAAPRSALLGGDRRPQRRSRSGCPGLHCRSWPWSRGGFCFWAWCSACGAGCWSCCCSTPSRRRPRSRSPPRSGRGTATMRAAALVRLPWAGTGRRGRTWLERPDRSRAVPCQAVETSQTAARRLSAAAAGSSAAAIPREAATRPRRGRRRTRLRAARGGRPGRRRRG